MILAKKQKGEALTLATVITVISTVLAAINTGGIAGRQWQAFENLDQMQNIVSVLKQKLDPGDLNEAQKAILAHRLKRNTALIHRLRDRILDRESDIVSLKTIVFGINMLSGEVAKLPNKTRFFASNFRPDGYSASVNDWLIPNQVNIKDIEKELGDLKQFWNKDEGTLQKAIVSAKIRSFWDGMNTLSLTRKQKRSFVKKFIAKLDREGWQIDGLDFSNHKQIKDYMKNEIRSYHSEQMGKPSIHIQSLSATPSIATAGEMVRLTAQVKVTGQQKKGALTSYFATPVGKVNNHLLATGRKDVSNEVNGDWYLPDDLPSGDYGYELVVSVDGLGTRHASGNIEVKGKDIELSAALAETLAPEKSMRKNSCPKNSKDCRSLFMKGKLNLKKSEIPKYEKCSQISERIKDCKAGRIAPGDVYKLPKRNVCDEMPPDCGALMMKGYLNLNAQDQKRHTECWKINDEIKDCRKVLSR